MIQTTKLSALALASLAAAYAPMGGFLPRALVSVDASGSEAQPQGAQPQGAQPQGAGQEEAGPPLPPQEPVGARPSDPAADRAKLIAAFQEMGIILADDADALGFSARVEVLNELLEYLLTTPQGASHESMFLTDVSPDGLTAAMLALGVGQGDNVQYVAKDPPPTREEARNGVPTHEVIVPSGGETYLYAAWRESSGARDATTCPHIRIRARHGDPRRHRVNVSRCSISHELVRDCPPVQPAPRSTSIFLRRGPRQVPEVARGLHRPEHLYQAQCVRVSHSPPLRKASSDMYYTECLGRIVEWIVSGQTPRAWKVISEF